MTKTITTVETIKLEGRVVGKIMQDESGFFYRPGTAGGLHNPKKDGDHFPSVKAVMASVNGDKNVPQATIAPKVTTKAPKRVLEPRPPIEGRKPEAAPTSKVRYKLVEMETVVGVNYWLYVGFERVDGFKWQSMAIATFPNLDDVHAFTQLNGIVCSGNREYFDTRTGDYYNPNK